MGIKKVIAACLLFIGISQFVCVNALKSTDFYHWVDGASILADFKPTPAELDTTSFLEYVVDPRTIAASMGCDGSFDCSQFQEQGQQGNSGPAPVPEEFYKPASQPPKVSFPIGRLPRQAKCYIKCDYRQNYQFVVGTMTPSSSQTESSFKPTHHMSTKAHAAASSFLEVEQKAAPADAIPINNIGSPFHCQTLCDFPEPLWCNPVRRMVVGSAGFSPQEHSCCDLCEAQCRSKTVVDRFRVCFLGCRAFCPFVSSSSS
eukprot:c18705_g1_i1.p1 GENE.c18705_g1_i1~~c18705_g1_i1.p1  ORF type:complete len:259 (+),score=131.04 c18705_g1_i1:73-849(+)